MRAPHPGSPCVPTGAPALADRALARLFAAIVPERACVPATGPLLGTVTGTFLMYQCGLDVRGDIRRTARDARWKPQSDGTITAKREAGSRDRRSTSECGARTPISRRLGPGITKAERRDEAPWSDLELPLMRTLRTLNSRNSGAMVSLARDR